MKIKCLLTALVATLGHGAWGMEGYDLTDPAQNRYVLTQRMKTLGETPPNLRGERKLGSDEYTLLKAPVARGSVGGMFVPSSIPKPSVDVPVLLFENSGVNHQEVRARGKTGPSESFTGFQDHGSAMASLINQIAPRGDVDVEYLENVLDALSRADIINFSNSYDLSRLPKEQLIGKVVVKAVGNSREDASLTDAVGENFEHILFAGNLTKDRRMSKTSGFPGEDPAVQKNFLWVVATDILTATGPQGGAQFSPTSGTSNAAAMLSGVLADFKSRFPDLTMPQIKQILLASADKSWTQTFGYDDGVVVGAMPGSSRLVRADYNPSIWGAGVLNYGRALRVASKINISGNPDLTPARLNFILGGVLRQEQQTQTKAATKIQSLVRGDMVRKAGRPERPRPEPLTIDETRKINYAKAPGTPPLAYDIPDDFDERAFIGAPPRLEVVGGTRPGPRMKRVGGAGSRVDDTAATPTPIATRAPSVPVVDSLPEAYTSFRKDILTNPAGDTTGLMSVIRKSSTLNPRAFVDALRPYFQILRSEPFQGSILLAYSSWGDGATIGSGRLTLLERVGDLLKITQDSLSAEWVAGAVEALWDISDDVFWKQDVLHFVGRMEFLQVGWFNGRQYLPESFIAKVRAFGLLNDPVNYIEIVYAPDQTQSFVNRTTMFGARYVKLDQLTDQELAFYKQDPEFLKDYIRTKLWTIPPDDLEGKKQFILREVLESSAPDKTNFLIDVLRTSEIMYNFKQYSDLRGLREFMDQIGVAGINPLDVLQAFNDAFNAEYDQAEIKKAYQELLRVYGGGV